MNNCATCQEALNRCFDAGDLPQGAVRDHLHGCARCTAYQAELEALDTLIGKPAAVEQDELFVARIQAAVAQTPAVIFPLWARVAVAVALILMVLGGGWMMDGVVPTSVPTLTVWQSGLPALPTSEQVVHELVTLPQTMLLGGEQLRALLLYGTDLLAVPLRGSLDQHGALVWSIAFVGIVLLLVVNTKERGHPA